MLTKSRFFMVLCTICCAVQLLANQPDSVYLFAYNREPAQGLSFAWSADGASWKSVANGASYVKSDYGAWGSQKKMYSPILMHRDDGLWHLEFRLNGDVNQYGTTVSEDLVNWKPQDYPFVADVAAVNSLFATYDNLIQRVQVNGKEYQGTVHRVPFASIQRLEEAQLAAAMRERYHNETLADDARRFRHLNEHPITATVTIDATAAKAISDKLIGIFFEDINYSADGGLYAELLQNRDFEYTKHDGGKEKNWTPTNSWAVKGEGLTFSIATDEPLHPNQQHYAVLDVQQPGAVLENDGFDGIVVRKGEKYDVSLFTRQLSGKAGKLKVQLREGDRVLGETLLSAPQKDWKQSKSVITAREDAISAVLSIEPTTAGTIALDFVSLFPQKTFKNRKNGLRADLVQVLADLHPRFMRFPGGCVAHGDGLGNIYHWKETIGPLWERKPARNLWGYHQTRGLGYFEYFQLCEDLGCEPLPVLAAAVSCQNSSHGGGGQQGGIPFGPEFEQYKQDILDLIEWANGDPKKSEWARKRAEAGHPKPFNLKYIGIGNEDLISDVFTERYLPLIAAVKAKYPDMIVCGTTGPFYEGSDYEEGWRLAKDHHIDMVDEHYYVKPGWYIHNQDFYDQYDRSASKVYLGEYASHGAGRKSTIETALTCAMHICGLERNGDVVSMSSYAPLLAKHGHTQWNPDLIYFDNEKVYPTVDYEVQLMCGQSQGDRYMPSTIVATQTDKKGVHAVAEDVLRRLAVSTVHDSHSGKTYVKLVNLLPMPVSTTFNALGFSMPANVIFRQLTGEWNSLDARATASASLNLSEHEQVVLPAYSFTVIEF